MRTFKFHSNPLLFKKFSYYWFCYSFKIYGYWEVNSLYFLTHKLDFENIRCTHKILEIYVTLRTYTYRLIYLLFDLWYNLSFVRMVSKSKKSMKTKQKNLSCIVITKQKTNHSTKKQYHKMYLSTWTYQTIIPIKIIRLIITIDFHFLLHMSTLEAIMFL